MVQSRMQGTGSKIQEGVFAHVLENGRGESINLYTRFCILHLVSCILITYSPWNLANSHLLCFYCSIGGEIVCPVLMATGNPLLPRTIYFILFK